MLRLITYLAFVISRCILGDLDAECAVNDPVHQQEQKEWIAAPCSLPLCSFTGELKEISELHRDLKMYDVA